MHLQYDANTIKNLYILWKTESGPDCGSNIFNEGSNAWIAQKTKLKSPRFGHSTLKVSKDWCD